MSHQVDNSHEEQDLTNRWLRTPRAAAIAGIIFSVLSGISIVLIRLTIPSSQAYLEAPLEDRAGQVAFALRLLPYAGIAFLWFLGVIRDRLGHFEDRFFSTVFFGSGLLYLAMTFGAAAIAGGAIITFAIEPGSLPDATAYVLNRAVIYQLSNVYGLRMAGIFMTSLGTIWYRTKVMPRPFALVTFGLAIVLLIGLSLNLWLSLIFPAWVFIVSAYILILNYRETAKMESDGMSLETKFVDKFE
jgi:hypothetical protein